MHHVCQDEEQEYANKAKQEGKADSGSGRQKRAGKSTYVFGGPIGTFFMTLGLPVGMLLLNLMCDKVCGLVQAVRLRN